jgi:hypothetical protein
MNSKAICREFYTVEGNLSSNLLIAMVLPNIAFKWSASTLKLTAISFVRNYPIIRRFTTYTAQKSAVK